MKIFPSTAEVVALGKGGIVPTVLKIRVSGKVVAIAYKPLDELVIHEMQSTINHTGLDHMDIVVGGDHGQGSYCGQVKMILHYKNNVVHVQIWVCIKVVCKKDNAALLQACNATDEPVNL